MKKKKERKKLHRLLSSRVSTKVGFISIFIIALPVIFYGGIHILSAGNTMQMVEGDSIAPHLGFRQFSGSTSGNLCPSGSEDCPKTMPPNMPPHIPTQPHLALMNGNLNPRTCG